MHKLINLNQRWIGYSCTMKEETGCSWRLPLLKLSKEFKILRGTDQETILLLWGNKVLKYTCYNLCEAAVSNIKHLSSTQNESSVIVYSFLCCSKSLCFSFFQWSKKWNVFPGCSLPHNESEVVLGPKWAKECTFALYLRLLKVYGRLLKNDLSGNLKI